LFDFKSMLFALSVFTCFADVMYDSLLVVEAKAEQTGDHGKKQTVCWIARAAGATIASFVAGFMLLRVPRRTIFLVQSAIQMLAVTFAICFISETPARRRRRRDRRGLCARAKQLVRAFTQPSLFRPAIFMFAFGATPSSYMAFFYFLVSELKFDTALLGTFKSIRHLAMLIGTVIFRRYLRGVNLRTFFMIMVIMSSILGASPLVLVTHVNRKLAIPDEVFVGGDDLFLSVFTQITLLPVLVLAAKLCPPGIEASLYAMFVSIVNLSSVVSEWLGGELTRYLDITRDNFTNLPVLITVCTLSTLFALVFVQCLPEGNIDSVAAAATTTTQKDDDDDSDDSDEGEEMKLVQK